MELLEWLKAGLELIAGRFGGGGLAGWIEHGLTALTLLLFLLALLLLYKDFFTCVLLLRRMNAQTPRGAIGQVAESVLRLAFSDRALLSREKRTLVRRTRILVEHELFCPRPQYDWRDGGMDPADGGIARRAGAFFRRRRAARRAYLHALGVWRARMARVLALEGDWTIQVDNPALVSGQLEAIGCYFECLRSLGFEGDEADRFICPIEVASGFITPLHLLTGLLVQFNEKWRPILESFDRDAHDRARRPGDPVDRDLRQIQLFVYNCWLLWGPSIPICECRNWAARYAVVQYGYGDENNSIEIVGEEGEIRNSLARLMTGQIKHERAIRTVGATRPPPAPFTGMAVPANVIGRLRLSGSLGGREAAQVNALPHAALESWGGGQDERPVLFISEIVSSNAVEGDVEHGTARRGRISIDHRAYPSRYYSAYLWAAVVVLVQTPGGPVPLSDTRPGRSEPWKDFIPFFEHGNLADPESCLFGKRQLAIKVVAGLASAVRVWGKERPPLHFAFACAIDEAGCGHDLAYPDWSGHVTMRTLIQEALQTLARTDPAARRIRDEKLLDFDHFGGEPGQHDFSACGFPGIVARHYGWMDRANADRMS